MANRISTANGRILTGPDHVAMNMKNFDNLNGGAVPGFGIIHGCEVSSQGAGNTLRINKGRVMVSGVLVELDETNIFLGSSTTTVNYQIVLTINLLTDTIAITTPLASTSVNMIDLIALPDTSSQIQLGRYTFASGTITNIVQGNTFPLLPMVEQWYGVNARLSGGSYSSATRIATWTIDKDMRANIQVGSKIKYTTTSATVYAIVHAITASTITLFHQSGIASLQTPNTTLIKIGIGRPLDFPINDRNNWTVRYLSTTLKQSTSSAAANVWYNNFSLLVGIGTYNFVSEGAAINIDVAREPLALFNTLSFTSGSTQGTDDRGILIAELIAINDAFSFVAQTNIDIIKTLTSSTTVYFNQKTTNVGSQLYLSGDSQPTVLSATSIYA